MSSSRQDGEQTGLAAGVAVIGMSGRFPGASDIEELWQVLRDGRETISRFTDEELEEAGVDPAHISNPSYVPAKGMLADAEKFDAAFFGFTPREAELMDPQQRVFLECAWSALENSGYNASALDGPIGVFAGSSKNSYLLSRVAAGLPNMGSLDVNIGNIPDFLSTRVSYKLNLKGPSMTVQTACSTSLVAICLAYQSLLDYQCDMVIAGGVCVSVPRVRGYPSMPGSIGSPDGHCRSFDALAAGTVGGEGVGAVVLKRLDDALRDGDTIDAVIAGAAINNDGADKVGYTAPSVQGQAEVISMALGIADIDPDSIGYVEAHGTATRLGDPIEIAALTRAYRTGSQRKGYCALGSIKSNFGHLDAAAGVAGFIKTVLCLKHKELVPSLHFSEPNPELHLEESPFKVNVALRPWLEVDTPRRAAVSSFGIGGTNAHIVMQEAPVPAPTGVSRPLQVMTLSARTRSALDTATQNLAAVLDTMPPEDFPDAAYTLNVGRRHFGRRRVVIAPDARKAADALRAGNSLVLDGFIEEGANRSVAFMFPGQGAQYCGMGLALYQDESVFREELDHIAESLLGELGLDLRELLYPQPEQAFAAAEKLNQTRYTQPALFAVEYAMAKLWMSWGVVPEAMIGHSIGEYVAACLAGVFSLDDALSLVSSRGSLMQAAATGSMVAVALSEPQIGEYLTQELSLAAVNEAGQCVLSGQTARIAELETLLESKSITCQKLVTSHAFHSIMMDDVLAPFEARLRKMQLQEPACAFISNVTGTWITAAQATDPTYWSRHLRQTVWFASGLEKLLEDPGRVLIEVGPGATLTGLAARSPALNSGHIAVSSTGLARDVNGERQTLLQSLGKMWLSGLDLDWQGFYQFERRRRVPLPTYPFERVRFWMEPSGRPSGAPRALEKAKDIARWFYMPSWQRSETPQSLGVPGRWLLFSDASPLVDGLAARLQAEGSDIVRVSSTEHFTPIGSHEFGIQPGEPEDYRSLLDTLRDDDWWPDRILHAWGVSTESAGDAASRSRLPSDCELSSVAFLANALGQSETATVTDLTVLTFAGQEVLPNDVVIPARSAVSGLVRVLRQESEQIAGRVLDIDGVAAGGDEKCIELILREVASPANELMVAYRHGYRWLQRFVPLDPAGADSFRFREGGVYLITGGLGKIGLRMAQHLAEQAQTKLVLISRTGVPDRPKWAECLEGEDDLVIRRIEGLQKIEAAGGEVMLLQADISDPVAVRDAVLAAEQRFGEICAVIHAAGTLSGESLNAVRTFDKHALNAQLKPKLTGASNLDAALEGRKLDFKLLMSSLSSVLGGLNLGAYASANAALDALPYADTDGDSTPWRAVDWDGWRFGEVPASGASRLVRLAMSPEEGMEVFQRALGTVGTPRMVISTADLDRRLEESRIMQPVFEEQAAQTEGPGEMYERPEMEQSFTGAESELQRKIAEVWQEFLGIGRVGILDDFFELGGHSLLSLRIISRLNEELELDLPVNVIFDNPTIAGLAEHVESISVSVDEDRMSELLDLVEGLSDDELLAKLASEDEGS